MRFRPQLAAILAVLLLAFACGGKKAPPKEPTITETVSDAGADDYGDAGAAASAEKSLYERLGGKEGLTKVVDSCMKAVFADVKIKARFAKTKGPKLEKLKVALVEQFCTLTGGPQTECDYKKDMHEVHKGMRIREDEWNAMVSDLNLALTENNVAENTKADLLALIGPIHDQIVTAKPAGKPRERDKK